MPRLGRNHKGHVYLKYKNMVPVLVLKTHSHSLSFLCERGEAGKSCGGVQPGFKAGPFPLFSGRQKTLELNESESNLNVVSAMFSNQGYK